jgi:hypothetical protein
LRAKAPICRDSLFPATRIKVPPFAKFSTIIRQ